MLKTRSKIKAQEKALLRISLWKNILLWALLSVGMNIILELLQRKFSLISTFGHIFLSFPTFLLNTVLIMLTTSFMLIVKRKWFAFAIPAAVWLVLGITNAVVLAFRPIPLSAADFRLMGEAFEMMLLYMKAYQIILVIVGFILLFSALAFVYIRTPKYENDKKKQGIIAFAIAFVLLITYAVTILLFDFFPRGNETPNEFYERNGFAYNFYKSMGATGVYTPSGYSDERADEIKAELEQIEMRSNTSALVKDKPNIIVLQLESFFDMTWMNGITLSEDPVPNFRKLKENNPTGYLFVPSYGGGTSNVEFEVLSGMNLDHFSIGESPYYTMLSDSVLTDAAPFNMKNMGYTAHAIHNYNATFYKRNIAYSHLGFDTFTSVEYMDGLSYNSLTWPKDDVIPKEIISALESTEGKDFVFTVSVQGHGPYPETVNPNEFTQFISVEGENLTPEVKSGLEFYASTIKEMDNVVGEMVEYINSTDEDCVLVIYGDHLPAIDFSQNYISAPNVYTSEYVICSNFGLEAENKDIEAYQLLAHVQDILDMNSGTLVKFHQEYSGNENYQEDLKVLEFSITNDKEAKKIKPEKLQYSTRPVKITDVKTQGESLYIYGENFTPCSKITVNGHTYAEQTEFISSECVAMHGVKLTSKDKVAISQMTRDNSHTLEVIE